jgi:hypothetical protein
MAERPSRDRDDAERDVERGDLDQGNIDQDIVDRHLQRAWQAFAPPSNLSELVRARLTSSTAATLGAAGLAMASNARPEGAWASLQASGKLGALVGAGLLGIGLLFGYLIRDRQQEAPPPAAIGNPVSEVSPPLAPPLPKSVPEVAPAATERVQPSVVPRAERSVSSAPRTRTERAAARDETQPNAGTPEPSDELALLRRAERAVRTDNAALALALIGELEERYPRSSLLEERRAIELMAYCSAGATDAVARAQRFLREYPLSAYAGRIRDLCPATGVELPAPR